MYTPNLLSHILSLYSLFTQPYRTAHILWISHLHPRPPAISHAHTVAGQPRVDFGCPDAFSSPTRTTHGRRWSSPQGATRATATRESRPPAPTPLPAEAAVSPLPRPADTASVEGLEAKATSRDPRDARAAALAGRGRAVSPTSETRPRQGEPPLG